MSRSSAEIKHQIVPLDSRYNHSYTPSVKTAISIPDPIFDAAEDLARRIGMSRSQLYTTAVKKYIDSFNDEAVTKALNEVYPETAGSMDPILLDMQFHSLPAEEW